MYAYAKTEDMGALEEFMSGTHQANLQSVGDRVFDEGMFEAARAIFAHIPNWGRLASTLVRLHQFQQAVDAARKANSPKTWKEVRFMVSPPIHIQCSECTFPRVHMATRPRFGRRCDAINDSTVLHLTCSVCVDNGPTDMYPA